MALPSIRRTPQPWFLVRRRGRLRPARSRTLGVAALPAHTVLEGFIVFLRDAQSGESFHAERLSRLSVELPSLVRRIPRDLGHAPHHPWSPRPPIVATEALSKRAIIVYK